MFENEEWRDIPGYEGFYQASNKGRIRSVERIVKCREGVNRRVPSKILSQNKSGNGGYLRVMVSVKGKTKYVAAHILVALAFIPNKHNKEQVNHINGNKHDNRAENLEWVTQSENMKHAYLIGLEKPRKVQERPVFCTSNGLEFSSIKAASRYIGRCTSTLRQAIRDKRPCNGLYFQYADSMEG